MKSCNRKRGYTCKHKADRTLVKSLFFKILERTRRKSEEYVTFRWDLIGECVDLYIKSKGLGMPVGRKSYLYVDMSTKRERDYLTNEFRYILNDLRRKHRNIIKMRIVEGRRYYSMPKDCCRLSEFF